MLVGRDPHLPTIHKHTLTFPRPLAKVRYEKPPVRANWSSMKMPHVAFRLENLLLMVRRGKEETQWVLTGSFHGLNLAHRLDPHA